MVIFFSLAIALRVEKVIRTMLARKNRRMDYEGRLSPNEAERDRIEQAAKLEGIKIAEAMEKQRGFRYLL
jgi:hypothetical protein